MNQYAESAPPIDASVVTGTSSTPWATPSLRKINEEIHDNATQMMILGKTMVALGDLMERLMKTIDKHDISVHESIDAIKDLTKTIKETLQ